MCNLGLLQIARGPLSAVRWVTMHAALMNCRRVMTLLASWSEFECPTDTLACAIENMDVFTPEDLRIYLEDAIALSEDMLTMFHLCLYTWFHVGGALTK